MKLFIHSVVTQVYDYDTHIGRNYGVAWSTNNEPGTALGMGIEWCQDMKAVRAKIAKFMGEFDAAKAVGIEIAEGQPIARRSNMNPHGLI